ncbi:MAG: UvrD-helicase domain-containing protein [Lachnospiraceae bacterium]|nr:UvrD-helicase domain-containing protein [Lachnospiraceae bacterium]
MQTEAPKKSAGRESRQRPQRKAPEETGRQKPKEVFERKRFMGQERVWSPRQLEILEAERENIEVLAAAGAGKTSVLVEKIFRLISAPDGTDVDRLLVMTFTRAAAAEMRERLASKLMDAIEEDPSNKRLLRQQMLLYGAQICTIDSFCQSVLREFYGSVDVDPSFRNGEEAEINLMKTDTVRELVEDLYARGDKEFLDFITCYTGTKDDGKIEEHIEDLAKCAMAHPDPDAWLDRLYVENEQIDIDGLMRSRDIGLIIEHATEILDGALNEARKIAELADRGGLEKYKITFESDAQLIEGARNAHDFVKRQAMLDEPFPKLPGKAGDNPDYDKDLAVRCKNIREGYKKRIKNLKEKFYSSTPEQILMTRNIGAAAARTLISATREYLTRLMDKKLDKNVLDFDDVSHYALKILTEKADDGSLLPSQRALTLRKRYDWIFVDEYQDSNEIQEELVNAIAGPAESAPYTFMVGDVKQSIYKFRMAKPELFMRRCELYRSDPREGKVVVLDSNYRSLAGILTSTNRVFERAMRKEIGGIDYDEEAALKPGTPAQTETECRKTRVVVVEGERENEIEKAAQIIKETATERGSYEGIAVLLRTKSMIGDYRRAFEEKGIPVAASETTGFLKTFEIRTMLDYLTIVDNPAHDIPFVGALASPIGGLENDELAQIRIEEGPERLWFEVARSYSESGSSAAIRSKLVRFFNAYDAIRSMNLCRDLGECIERIYDLTGFMTFCRALPNGDVRAANLNLLIDYAYAYEKSSYTGLFSFVRYIEQLKRSDQDLDESEAVSGGNAVTIMTIHKSKGLEFPVVLIGGMTRKLIEMDSRDSMIKNSDYGIRAVAIDPEKRIKLPTVSRAVVRLQMTLEMKGEELRLLYVGMTRAREQLIMIGNVKDLSSGKNHEAWEQAAISSSDGSAYSYSYIDSASSYLDFVVPAAISDPEHFDLEFVAPAAISDPEHFDPETEHESATSEATLAPDLDAAGMETAAAENASGVGLGSADRKKTREELIKFYREALCEEETDETRAVRKKLTYKYPYEEYSKIPTKLSVSDIKKKHIEEEGLVSQMWTPGRGVTESPERVYEGNGTQVSERSSEENVFGTSNADEMAKTERLSGAEYGTLLHKVMRFIPFDITTDGIEDYLDEIEKRGIIGVREKEAIDRSDIAGFVGSPIFERLSRASENRTIRREQPFICGILADEIDSENYGNSKVLIPVQGVIDCLFEEDGKVFVLDYKTDRKNEQQLRDSYKSQLELYMKAATAALGKPAGEMIIYSFNMKRSFEI